jgi:hypothetical protein
MSEGADDQFDIIEEAPVEIGSLLGIVLVLVVIVLILWLLSFFGIVPTLQR